MAVPRPTLTEALCSPAFEAMLPQLVAFAARLLRRAGRGKGPDAGEAEDAVHEAIEACLDGARTWPEGVDLAVFLDNVIRSQLSHHRTRAVRSSAVCLDEIAEPCAPSSRRDDRLDAARLVAAIQHTVAVDPDTEALFAIIADGAESRAVRAKELGWTPEHTSDVRAKMNRLIEAAGLWENEDDEEPRSRRSPRPSTAPPGGPRRRAAG